MYLKALGDRNLARQLAQKQAARIDSEELEAFSKRRARYLLYR